MSNGADLRHLALDPQPGQRFCVVYEIVEVSEDTVVLGIVDVHDPGLRIEYARWRFEDRALAAGRAGSMKLLPAAHAVAIVPNTKGPCFEESTG